MKRNHPLLAGLEFDPFVSVESVDIDEAIQDALDLSQASMEALAVREADEASGHIQASLESLHRTLVELNADGGLTASQWQLAQLSLESNCQRLQVPVVDLGVSLESFTEEAPKQTVSLEGLEAVIKTVDANHGALAADARDAADKLCEVLKGAIPNAAARLAAIVARAEAGGVNNSEATVPGEGVAVFLMNGESFPDDFPCYLRCYVGYGKQVVGPFAEAAHRLACDSVAFRQVSFADPAAFVQSTSQAHEQANGHLNPRGHIEEAYFQLCLPGSGPLFADAPARTVTSHPVFSSMNLFTHQLQPVDPSSYEPEAAAPETLPRLSAEQISELGRALHELCMTCDVAQYQENGTQGGWNCIDDTIAKYAELYDGASEAVVAAVDNEAGLTMEYLATIAQLTRWTPLYFYANLVQTINAFLVYAERSLGSPAVTISAEGLRQPPTMVHLLMSEKTNTGLEGIDTSAGVTDGNEGENISLEGAFKWRTGMRVKYSGGHGKIIKVFDRPTKYKGQIHHCTKDNPRYEVRSEKGNHLSLHRASALSPA